MVGVDLFVGLGVISAIFFYLYSKIALLNKI